MQTPATKRSSVCLLLQRHDLDRQQSQIDRQNPISILTGCLGVTLCAELTVQAHILLSKQQSFDPRPQEVHIDRFNRRRVLMNLIRRNWRRSFAIEALRRPFLLKLYH